jgi:hypothetical protein
MIPARGLNESQVELNESRIGKEWWSKRALKVGVMLGREAKLRGQTIVLYTKGLL